MTVDAQTKLAVGVDYLTVTVKKKQEQLDLIDALYHQLGSDWYQKNSPKKWAWMGYHGLQSEGVRYGIQGDGAIVVLSGDVCARLWRAIAPKRGRVTRIDLQVTVTLARAEPMLALIAYKENEGKGTVTRSLWQNSRGGSTLYVGARASRLLGRLYNKDAERGENDAINWRYEVEIKKPLADAVVSRLLETTDVNGFIVAYVHSFFTARGVTCRFSPTDTESVIEIGTIVTSPEKSLNWLRTQVRPTVARLIVQDREAEVREALGLPIVQPILPNL